MGAVKSMMYCGECGRDKINIFTEEEMIQAEEDMIADAEPQLNDQLQ